MGDLSTNFSRAEFACQCGCGFDTVDAELLAVLERIRNHFDVPVWISSAARCETHNSSDSVKGGKHSQHLLGRAADIVVDGVPAELVQEYANQIEVSGVGSYGTFTHIDTRAIKARWSN